MSITKYDKNNNKAQEEIEKTEDALNIKRGSLLDVVKEETSEIKKELYYTNNKNKRGLIEKTIEKDLGHISLNTYQVTRADIDYAIKDGENKNKFRNIFITTHNKKLTKSLINSGFELLEENDNYDIVATFLNPEKGGNIK